MIYVNNSKDSRYKDSEMFWNGQGKWFFFVSYVPYNPKLKVFSRNLRRDGEKAEALLWKRE